MATHYFCNDCVENHAWYFRQIRTFAAHTLLFVYLPMIMCITMHVHQEMNIAANECYDCTHRLSHPIHIDAAYNTHYHDCILCHMLQVLYLPAHTIIVYRHHTIQHSVRLLPHVVVGTQSVKASRAPPCTYNKFVDQTYNM